MLLIFQNCGGERENRMGSKYSVSTHNYAVLAQNLSIMIIKTQDMFQTKILLIFFAKLQKEIGMESRLISVTGGITLWN